jgi:hypothetical protein
MELPVAKVRGSLRWHPRPAPDADHDIVGRYRFLAKMDMEHVRVFDRENFPAEPDILVLTARPLHVVAELLARHGIELRVEVMIDATGIMQIRQE